MVDKELGNRTSQPVMFAVTFREHDRSPDEACSFVPARPVEPVFGIFAASFEVLKVLRFQRDKERLNKSLQATAIGRPSSAVADCAVKIGCA